jgi:Protein of unknown function (DUF3105)
MSRASAGKRRSSARRRKSGGINWIWVIVGVGALAIIAGLVINLSRQLQNIEGVQTYGPFTANLHVQGNVTYQQSPPVGGEHFATWQNCGIYDAPVQNELAVHALEHGAVWIAYRPDLPADQVEQLRGLARGRPYALLSPYPELDAAVAISAWGFQLKVDQASDPRLNQFLNKYMQGPQTPEPGAACFGGNGSPIDG